MCTWGKTHEPGFPDVTLTAMQGRYDGQHLTEKTAEVWRGKSLAEDPRDSKWYGAQDWLQSQQAHHMESWFLVG